MAILKSFLRDEQGATAIEYGLIAAGYLGRHHHGGAGSRLEPEHDVRQREERIELTFAALPARQRAGGWNLPPSGAAAVGRLPLPAR